MQLIEGNIFYSIVIRQCATLVNMEVKGRKAEKQICGESGITFAPASAPTPAPVLMLMLKCFTALARLLMLMVMVMVRMKTIVCSKDDFHGQNYCSKDDFQLVMVRMKTIVCSKDDFHGQNYCVLYG